MSPGMSQASHSFMLVHVILSLHEQLAEPIECRGILIDGDMSLSLEAASTMDAGGAVSKAHPRHT